MSSNHFQTDDAETVGKEIQQNIEQNDGLILISVTNDHKSGQTFIRLGIHNSEKVIAGLDSRAFKGLNPGTTLQFIEQVISALSYSHYKITTEISRIQKLN